MTRGDVVVFQRRNDDGDWERYGSCRLISANKAKSREFVEGAAENSSSRVTFRFRWHKQLEDIEFDMDCYRLIWRKQVFDITSYDDFMYQHKTIDIEGASYRGLEDL